MTLEWIVVIALVFVLPVVVGLVLGLTEPLEEE